MSEQTISTFLDEHGLMCVAFAHVDLPEQIASSLAGGREPDRPDTYYVLLANGGQAFWRSLMKCSLSSDDPVDQYSEALAREFAAKFFNDTNPAMLYPGLTPVPLITLGELAGWSSPSPLGLGINREYGLWFAYRALFRTNVRPADMLMWKPLVKMASSCADCIGTPCVSACPGLAVSLDQPFNINACGSYRSKEISACSDNCLSRRACPVGTAWTYDTAQLAHHMRHSLDGMLRWLDSNNSDC